MKDVHGQTLKVDYRIEVLTRTKNNTGTIIELEDDDMYGKVWYKPDGWEIGRLAAKPHEVSHIY